MSAGAGPKVLVLASDPLLAALVGAVVDLARLSAEFAKPDERPEAALDRVRPLAAILVDAVTDTSESDLFLQRARRSGTKVLLFGSLDGVRQRAHWARTNDVPTFALPDQFEELASVLTQLRTPAVSPRKAGRRAVRVEHDSDGTLVFCDSAGTRWSVYDRRLERRRNVIDRRFVNPQGEVRHCDVTEDDAKSESATVLEAQFARAEIE